MKNLAAIAALVLGASVLGQTIPAPKPPFTLGPDTTAIVAPLFSDGSPDYLAAINEKQSQGVTPENNGFVLFLQCIGEQSLIGPGGSPSDPKLCVEIFRRCGALPTPPGTAVLVAYSDYVATTPRDPRKRSIELGLPDIEQARNHLWTPDQHPELAAFLKAQGPVFDRIVAAAERPRWWCPYIASASHARLSDRFGGSWLRMAREVAADLCARATLRAKGGDLDAALRDALAVKRLAHHLGGCAAMNERLLAAGLDQQANETLGVILASGALSATQCAALAESLAAAGPLAPLSDSVDAFERYEQLDRVVGIGMNRPPTPTDGMGGMFASIDRDAVDWDVVLKRINRTYDQIVAALKEPSLAVLKKAAATAEEKDKQWVAESAGKGFDWLLTAFQKRPDETREAYSERFAAGILVLYLPSFGRAEELHRRARIQDELLTVLLAAAKVKAQTGAWPASLEALIPAAFPAVPKDPYSADEQGPIRYVLTNGRPRVYVLALQGQDLAGARPNIAIGDPAPPPPAATESTLTAEQRRDRVERELVAFLREIADCDGGPLPQRLDRPTVEALQEAWLTRHKQAEPSKGGSREEMIHYEEWRARIITKLGALSNGWNAIADPLSGTDWQYGGAGITLGEKAKDQAILWYKPFGQTGWRIIQGDLTIHDDKEPPRDGARRPAHP